VIQLKRIPFEFSHDRLVKSLIDIVSSKASGEADLFLLEKYRNLYKEVTLEEGFRRTGREIRLESNPCLAEIPSRTAKCRLLLNSDNEEMEVSKSVFQLQYKGEPLGLITFPIEASFNSEVLETVLELEMVLGYSLERTSEQEAYRRLKLVSRLTSVLETETMIEQLIYRSLEIAREMLRVRWIFFLERASSKFLLKAAIGDGANPLNGIEFSLLEDEEKELRQIRLFVSAKRTRVSTALFSESATVGSFIVLPLYSEGVFMGLIVAADREEVEGEFRPYRNLDEEDLKILDDVGRRMAVAISRLRLTSRLELEVRKLKQLGKKHEELIKEQRDQLFKLGALHKISQAMKRSLDYGRIVRILLTGATSVGGLNFDRAIFLRIDPSRASLSPEERTEKTAEELDTGRAFYGDFTRYLENVSLVEQRVSEKRPLVSLSYQGNAILERVITRRKIVHVTPETIRFRGEELSALNKIIGADEYLIAPVSGEEDAKGLVIVDNSYSRSKISNADIEILGLLADSAGVALELTENYSRLLEITESLEKERNISNFYRRSVSSILQSLESSIVVCSVTGEVTEMNRTAELLLDVRREQLIGKNIEVLHPKLTDIIELLADVLRIGETITLTEQYLEALGEGYFDVRITPLREDNRGRLNGVIISLDDVTRRRKLEQEFKSREKLAALGEMSARVAHEIRNPITIIGGFVKRISNTNDKEKIREYAKILMDELRRLDGIVGEVLEVSRSKRSVDTETFDLVLITKEIIEGFAEKADISNVKLFFDCEYDDLYYYGNKNRIKQVIINLVQNAIEASEDGGKILVDLEMKAGWVHFSVSNRGRVIPQEILKRIFEPFFTTKTLGTGLGLSICKKIVEEHGGNIEAESSEKGTIFTFWLPVKMNGRYEREEDSYS
jgi:PAS domain S-box-containing protein